MDPDSLYVQLGRLVEIMPDLTEEKLSASSQQWLGRAHALVSENGDLGDELGLKQAANHLGGD